MTLESIQYYCGLAEVLGDSQNCHFIRQLTTVLDARARNKTHEGWVQNVAELVRSYVDTGSYSFIEKIKKEYWKSF
jgi:hypothetical protein